MSDRLARLSRQHALFPWERRTHSERTSERAEAVLAGIAAAVEWKRDQDKAARQQATEAAEQRAAAEEIERNQSAEMMAGACAELRIAIETDPQAAERDMLALIERLGIQPSAPGTGSLMSGFNSDPAFSSDEALASFDMDATINATIVSHESEHQPGEEEVPADGEQVEVQQQAEAQQAEARRAQAARAEAQRDETQRAEVQQMNEAQVCPRPSGISSARVRITLFVSEMPVAVL